MRSLFLAAAIAAAVLTGTLPGAPAPPPASAATAPKVAVIVGPVSGSTAGYIRDADAAANEALKYTPNVVKVYSPNATWEAAKAAMQGASIVIYMGHGNGFPSPYTTSLAPDRQNGLGVNPTAGVNDSTTKYYGEQFLRNEVRAWHRGRSSSSATSATRPAARSRARPTRASTRPSSASTTTPRASSASAPAP